MVQPRPGKLTGPGAASSTGYVHGAIVRQLTSLCQRVDTLAIPLPPPGASDRDSHSAPAPSDRSLSTEILSLPKLVMVGGQSAGKSSLVQCLAGVTLPSSAGTCTRGPLDVVITPTDDGQQQEHAWSAIVSLVLPANGGHSSNEACSTILQFGDVIKDRSLVADRVRRASLAILDNGNLRSGKLKNSVIVGPVIVSSDYLDMTTDELVDAEESFASPSFFPVDARLTLSIRAPGAQPLSFTDLPGYIDYTMDDDSQIHAARDMIKREIRSDTTIIIYVAALDVDLAAQSAFRLVRAADPLGQRTIGVLTKPDRMTRGDRQWIRMIDQSSPLEDKDKTDRGSKYLKHGWFVVRCLGEDEDLGNIEQIEQDFFHGDGASSAWQHTARMLKGISEPGDFVHTRCGLGNLSKALSKLLLQQIRTTFPSTLEAVLELAARLGKELEAAKADKDDPAKSAFPSHTVSSPGNDSLDGARLLDSSVSGFAKGLPVQRELIKWVDTIIGHFQMLRCDINTDLAPRLLGELLTIAPVYLPFTAVEAKDPQIVAAYHPQPWAFHKKLTSDLGRTRDDCADSDHQQESLPIEYRPRSAKKKAITVDELIDQLTSGRIVSHKLAWQQTFKVVHDGLRARFSTAVTSYSKFVREHLTMLIRDAVPKGVRATYAQLVEDLVDKADVFVQEELRKELRMLSREAEQYSHCENGVFAYRSDDGKMRDRQNEYADWVAHEHETYLMLRMNLIVKEQIESGNKQYLQHLNKIVEEFYKAGWYCHDRHKTELYAAHPIPNGAAQALAQAATKTPPKKTRKSMSAPPSSPSPEPAATKNSLQQSVPSRPATPILAAAPARQRVTSPLFEAEAATPGAHSTPKLQIFPRLVLLADNLNTEDPYMATALDLMAHLRADFNFFALHIAEEVQRVPVRIMQGLYTHLRFTVSPNFGVGLTVDEAYERYFFEADRPRREQQEWMRELKNRLEVAHMVVGELQAIQERLDGIVDVNVEKNGRGNERLVGNHTATNATTPDREAATPSSSTKTSPATPRKTTAQLKPSTSSPKKRPSPADTPSTPSKIRNTATTAPRSIASMVGVSTPVRPKTLDPLSKVSKPNEFRSPLSPPSSPLQEEHPGWLDPLLDKPQVIPISSDTEGRQ